MKKNDWHENVWQPVVNRDKSHDRSGRPDKDRATNHELKRGPAGRRSSNARQLGCVFQDMEPPKSTSILRKSSDIQKPIQRVKFTKAVARHADIRDQNPPSVGQLIFHATFLRLFAALPSAPTCRTRHFRHMCILIQTCN